MTDEAPKWISTDEATKRSGLSRRQLQRLAQSGKLARRVVDDIVKFSVADLDRYIEQGEVGPETTPIEVKMLQQAYQFIDQLMKPAQMFAQMVESENRALRKRCRQLEDGHGELVKAREELLDGSTERSLLLQGETNRMETKRFAMEQLKPALQQLLIQLGGKGTMGKLLASLTEEQKVLLLETDLISEQQKELLRAALGVSGKPKDAPKKDAPKAQTDADGDPVTEVV